MHVSCLFVNTNITRLRRAKVQMNEFKDFYFQMLTACINKCQIALVNNDFFVIIHSLIMSSQSTLIICPQHTFLVPKETTILWRTFFCETLNANNDKKK